MAASLAFEIENELEKKTRGEVRLASAVLQPVWLPQGTRWRVCVWRASTQAGDLRWQRTVLDGVPCVLLTLVPM